MRRARPADLIKRTEPAIRATRAEAACQCLRRAAKESVRQNIIGRAEVGVVKDVEEFSAKPEANLFRKSKLPLNRDIRLPGSKAAQHIATEVALLSGWRPAKSRRIENFAARIAGAIEHKGYSWLYVRPRIQGNTIGIYKPGYHVHRWGRSCEHEAVN